MLCTLTRPGETVDLYRGWAAWLVLDFIVTAFFGTGTQARALFAIIGLYVLAITTGSCSSESQKSHEDASKKDHSPFEF